MNEPSEQELIGWQKKIANGLDWSIAIKAVVNCPRQGWQGQLADGSWKVGLKEPASDNRANEALLKWLANEVGCRTQDLKIISGQTSRRKIIRLAK